MCLAVPGRIIDIRDDDGILMGTLDFDGIRKDACLAYLPDVGIGDYAIVHVGFAISRIDEADAQKTLAIFREMGTLAEELGDTGATGP